MLSADGRWFGDRTAMSYDEAHEGTIHEVEGYRYPDARIMAFQGHPEWGGAEYARYAGEKLAAWFDSLGELADNGIPIRVDTCVPERGGMVL